MITRIKSAIPEPIKTFKRKIVRHYNNVRPPIYGDKDKDLFLGPWLSDIGAEIEYSIPYLIKLKTTGRLQHKRLYAVSRGGVENWYGGLTDNYIRVKVPNGNISKTNFISNVKMTEKDNEIMLGELVK